MSFILEHATNAWAIIIPVIGLIVHQLIRLMMFKAAIKNSKPAERPKIILAMRGLIGRRSTSQLDDKEQP
ncbi:hypothetical protein ACFWIW_33375 [Amycolatopsis sp. NPDC058340]|uniref:hypothetical protein n=1 Tax=Amycolatopsis sp. NPDC058340 TaxID=3346453 RepID=UPI00365B2177